MTANPPAPPTPAPPAVDRRTALAGVVALVLFGLVAAGLVALVVLARNGDLPASGTLATDPAAFSYGEVRPAPPLELTDQDGRPFDLASLLGRPVLVFFGYTHCPDVCPATVGIINQALAATSPGARVVFVSIDPERDDVAAMKTYLRYLPTAYTGLTGTPGAVRSAADSWGVRYAKIEQGSPDGYAMSHTADVFLVDAAGRLVAHFPFGTTYEPIAAALAGLLVGVPPPSDAPAAAGPGSDSAARPSTATTAPPSPTPASTPVDGEAMGSLSATVVSTSIWAGGQSPVIFAIADAMGMPLDGSTEVKARVVNADGSPAGPDVAAVAIRPTGETEVSYVATLDIPSSGSWRIDLVAATGATGSVTVDALDQGATARLGSAAPDVDTPTLADVGGNLLAISTLPQADARLYQSSTADARAAGRPYVLVIDSARFKVSPACGRALSMIRYMLDRWPDVTFIHLEPFEYQLVTGEPVLSGDIASPPLNRSAAAFGLGDATWPSTKMPWIFVVDGNGIVRAKATGIVGSADVDLILSEITGEGVLGG
jgi:protein SCO1